MSEPEPGVPSELGVPIWCAIGIGQMEQARILGVHTVPSFPLRSHLSNLRLDTHRRLPWASHKLSTNYHLSSLQASFVLLPLILPSRHTVPCYQSQISNIQVEPSSLRQWQRLLAKLHPVVGQNIVSPPHKVKLTGSLQLHMSRISQCSGNNTDVPIFAFLS